MIRVCAEVHIHTTHVRQARRTAVHDLKVKGRTPVAQTDPPRDVMRSVAPGQMRDPTAGLHIDGTIAGQVRKYQG